MRFTITATLSLLLAIAAVSTQSAAAQGAPASPPHEQPLRAELALDYSYIRSNAPPASCTCFNLNGGTATFAWPVKQAESAPATSASSWPLSPPVQPSPRTSVVAWTCASTAGSRCALQK